MRSTALAFALAVALSLVASPRPAFAVCPDDPSGCDADATEVTMDSPPAIDADGEPIPFVEEVDAPPLGIALVDGDPD